MQYTSATLKRGRIAVIGLALLMGIGFGSAAAAPREVGFTECNQSGCAHGYPSARASVVGYLGWAHADGDYVSTGPLDIGFVE